MQIDGLVELLFEELPRTPEERLWRAVVTQACLDATGKLWDSCKGARQKSTSDAVAWFRGRRDFVEVCIMAGLDPQLVIERVDIFLKTSEKKV